MKASLQRGNRAEVLATVTEAMCPAFDGVVVHQVYSTWSLAHHMELAARLVLAPHLEAHEEGIGAELHIDHLAPTPVGHRVRVEAVAVDLDESTLVCEVTAHDLSGQRPRLVARGRQVQRILPRKKLEAIIERARHDHRDDQEDRRA
jgi:predicted thioesterase